MSQNNPKQAIKKPEMSQNEPKQPNTSKNNPKQAKTTQDEN